MIATILPEPTVHPPSRTRLGKPCVANGVFYRFSVIRLSDNIDFPRVFRIFATKDTNTISLRLYVLVVLATKFQTHMQIP